MSGAAPARLPYPGLRAYRRDETDLFFGRDGCVNEMVDRLGATHLLAVMGTSGSGKSSLVRTGLFDALEIGYLADAGISWAIADCHPGNTPTRNLAAALLAARGGAGDSLELDAMETFLRSGPLSVVEWIEAGNLPKAKNLLILVDQFEELFRYDDYAGREEAESLVALLLESASATVPIYVVITMRSEYLGACALIPSFAERINQSIYLARRMTLAECREAIMGPASVIGFDIEPRLVTRLLNDLGSFAPWDTDGESSQLERLSRQADQLPLMQHVLNRLWLRAAQASGGGPVTLSLAEYLAIGQLQGALDQHAGEILAALGAARRPVAEAVFRGLVSGTSAATAIREPTRLHDLQALAAGDPEAVIAVVEAFRAPTCNFLRPPAAEPLQGDSMVDISHESLIRQWSVLSGWLEQEARDAAMWRRLVADVDGHQRGERGVLAGIDLANVRAWWLRSQPNVAWAARHGGQYEAVRAFLARSDEREQADRTANRRRERRERNLAWSAAGTLLALLVVGLLAGWAYYSSQEQLAESYDHLQAANVQANQERAEANQGRDMAQRASDLALNAVDQFLTNLARQFEDTAAIPQDKLTQVLADGDRFLLGMSSQLGTTPQLVMVQAKLLLRFAEISMDDDLPAAEQRIDRAEQYLHQPGIKALDGAPLLQAEAKRLAAQAAYAAEHWQAAETDARAALALLRQAAPPSDEWVLATAKAKWALGRALWKESADAEAQKTAASCVADLAGRNLTDEMQFTRAKCLNVEAVTTHDANQASGDQASSKPAGVPAEAALFQEEIALLSDLVARNPLNISYKIADALALNNLTVDVDADPQEKVGDRGLAITMMEQALSEAAWSTKVKQALSEYHYFQGKELRALGSPDTLDKLLRAKQLGSELVQANPNNALWQADHENVLLELRSYYTDLDWDTMSQADIAGWVDVEQELLHRQLVQTGPAPPDKDALFTLVADYGHSADALYQARQSVPALAMAKSGAELVDGQASQPGADPRFRYWAQWLRQSDQCSHMDPAATSVPDQIALCEATVTFIGNHLEHEPRDWFNQRILANARERLATLYLAAGDKDAALLTMRLAAAGGSKDAVRTLAQWYRTGDGPSAIDEAEAGHWNAILHDNNWELHRYTVQAFWWSQTETSGTSFYVRDPDSPGSNTLEDEIYRVEVIEGIRLQDDFKSEIRDLWTWAKDNHVGFSKAVADLLARYKANDQVDRIFPSLLDTKTGAILDMAAASAAAKAAWSKPAGPEAVRAAFRQIAKQGDDAMESLMQLSTELDRSGLPEAAASGMTAVIEQPQYDFHAPVLANLYDRRAEFREHAHDIADALRDYNQAAVLQPNDADILNSLGYLQLEADVALNATVAVLERARTLAPDDLNIRDSLGWSYVKTGRVEDGLTLLRQVIAGLPDRPEPYAHLGDGLRRLGKTAEAQQAFTDAEARHPDDTLAEFIRKQRALMGSS